MKLEKNKACFFYLFFLSFIILFPMLLSVAQNLCVTTFNVLLLCDVSYIYYLYLFSFHLLPRYQNHYFRLDLQNFLVLLIETLMKII